MIAALRIWWPGFWYNFGWSDWVPFIDGWIPRLSLAVPIVGYLVLFNDTIATAFEFAHITSHQLNDFGLTSTGRLRFVYFGLIALGISNFVYRLKKPFAFRFGTNAVVYIKTALEVFAYQDFVTLHAQIRDEGHLTTSGKYYDSEWDGFVAAARNEGEGTNRVTRSASWDRAKNEYGSLLRSILWETFFRQNTQRRVWLMFCVTLSSIGYALLAVPSLDLFAKVARSTFL
jgi:hypothetical protein